MPESLPHTNAVDLGVRAHKMHLRHAYVDDLATLNSVALAAKAHWGYSATQLQAWHPDLLIEPETIRLWPTFVVEFHGRVVGFTQANPNLAPWELVSLWVLPEFMGRGAGRALLQEVLRSAACAGQPFVEIDADPNALGFYRACGAELVASVPAPIAGNLMRVRPQLRVATSAVLPNG